MSQSNYKEELLQILNEYKYGKRKDGYTVSLAKDRDALAAIDRLNDEILLQVDPDSVDWESAKRNVIRHDLRSELRQAFGLTNKEEEK